MWNYFEASGYLWHLALIRKTSRSKSFGMPSAPREGSLPPNSCLYKIKYTIHYNRIPYAVLSLHLSWPLSAHSRHYFDEIRWLHRTFVIIHFVVQLFASNWTHSYDLTYNMFVSESFIMQNRQNRHIHVFIMECSPFLNSLEWLTRSCLWQRYHLLFVWISTTWDRVVEILSHTPSKNRWPGIKTIEEIVIHLSKT